MHRQETKDGNGRIQGALNCQKHLRLLSTLQSRRRGFLLEVREEVGGKEKSSPGCWREGGSRGTRVTVVWTSLKQAATVSPVILIPSVVLLDSSCPCH